MGVHHGKLHPLWDIGWGDTYFDINAFKAHSNQKDIKQGDTYFDINAFKAHSKQKGIEQGDTLFISMLL